jgi:seryl-tRNA synthetase
VGESQSRYSIVANLTNTKLALMDSRDSLDNELLETQQDLELSQANVKADKVALSNEFKKRCDKVDRDVKEKRFKVENLKKGLKSRKDSINQKIKQIDESLKKLEEISKSSQSSD